MVSIKWCLSVKNGLELVEPNENMSISYLKMAEESLHMIQKNKDSKIWFASISYYTIYYSLYSLMMKIGVKSEIHQCSIEFMKIFLSEFYNNDEIKLIETAFNIRNDLQYYPDKLVDETKLSFIERGAVDFFIKSKNIIARISEIQIIQIRRRFKEKNER